MRDIFIQEHELAAEQQVDPARLLLVQLQEQLTALTLPTSGRKAVLAHRLQTFLTAAAVHGRAV